MKPVTILKRARKLIEKPERWIQGPYARTRDGVSTFGSDPAACAFCMAGAIQRVTNSTDGDDAAETFLDRATRDGLYAFNEKPGRKHAQVLRAFDKAIALAEKDGAR